MDTTAEWVLHVDLDQFLAAVEVRRHPELAGLPVVVGGDGNPRRPRQVVATASYEARAFGVHSGMPMSAALRRCPECVFLPHDRKTYEAASAEVMAVLRSFPVTVEEWGWDEAFVGVRTDDPRRIAEKLRTAVLERTGLSCAVGIGDTRLVAKTATGAAKPGGIAALTRREWFARLRDEPVTVIWGIGDRIAKRLDACGVTTVAELAHADVEILAAAFGPRIGPSLKIMGLGGDTAPIVDEPRVAKGRSKETTFTEDLTDPVRITAEVDALARAVAESVVADGRAVTHVAVKVRTRTFFTRTKIAKLPAPTTDVDAVAGMAAVVLGRFPEDVVGRPIRLLGVRVELLPSVPSGAGRDADRMSPGEARVATATRQIDAAPARIFEAIADPSHQPSWDGNDNLATAEPGQRVRAVGDVFVMRLTGGQVRDNHVVEFQEGRLIAWKPAEPGQPPVGHLWRWQLEPIDEDHTRVTHTYDWTDLHDENRFPRARATTSDRLLASIDRLASILGPEA